MKHFSPRTPHANPSGSESGYMLLAVIFLTFMLLLSLAIAAPKIATSIQRQKEIETVHRGEQYKRAIQLYYRKFGQYPTTIDQLVNSNNIRFLRKRYIDPLTGKDDWKLVRFGQAHVRPLGFFGQPLGTGAVGGMAGASIISSSMYAAVPTSPDGSPAATDDSASSSSGSAAAAPQPGAGTGPSMAGTPGGFGATSGSGFGSTTGSGFGATTGTGFGSTSTPGMSPAGGFGSTSTSTSTSPFGGSPGGTSATTFGGGGFIVGVTLPVKKPSLLAYKKQTNYNQWEFNYDPMEDQMNSIAGVGGGATNLNGTPSSTMPGVGSPSGGIGPGGTPAGTSPTTGSGGPSFGGMPSGSSGSGDSGTPPSTPQQ